MNDFGAAKAESLSVHLLPVQRAVATMAADVLGCQVGDRVATTQSYQEQLGVGAGTINKALLHLQSLGALRVRGRGHQGTVITALKRGLLWQLSGRQPLRVAVTPPGAPDQYGLATALCDLLAESGVPVRLKFMRGAQRRLKALSNNEADVATLSKQAQQSLSEEWQGELAAVEGGPVQYYNPSLLIVVERGKQRKERPVRRVGIDRDSPDHVALTEAEFAGMNVEFVDCRFIEVPTAILLGEIDAGVWHRRLTLIPPELAGLKVRPMRNTGVLVSSSDIVSAVLCFQAKDSACEAVLREIDMSRVRAMQDEFLAQDLGADELDSRLWVR